MLGKKRCTSHDRITTEYPLEILIVNQNDEFNFFHFNLGIPLMNY